MRLTMVVGFVLLLLSCASVTPVLETAPRRVVGQEPTLGTETTATPGGVVLAEYDYFAASRAVTMLPYTRAVGFNSIRIAENTTLFPAQLDGQDAWCSQVPVWFAAGEARPMCFISDENRRLVNGYVAGTLASIRIAVDIPFRTIQAAGRAGFRHELLYQGRDRNTVKFSLREFSENLSRPDSQQDLAFTLSDGRAPTLVSVRNARIEILAADNDRIRFRVLQGLR
jgi:hypothetical protein